MDMNDKPFCGFSSGHIFSWVGNTEGPPLGITCACGKTFYKGPITVQDKIVREAVDAAITKERHEFKNFHRNLCERFNYHHDEIDWKRDQISLIEHIALLMFKAQTIGDFTKFLLSGIRIDPSEEKPSSSVSRWIDPPPPKKSTK